MHTPLPILRKRAEVDLMHFAASSGADPEEVWGTLMTAQSKPEVLEHSEAGEGLWESFLVLRSAEKAALTTFAS
jgi:hypothetical protein